MILRHAKEPIYGQPVENTFCAVDMATGECVATSVISSEFNEVMFPFRPLRVRLDFIGNELPDMLLGATVARAQEICIQSNQFSRIYASCAPDDIELINQLEPFGFEDNDGLLRMRMPLPCAAVLDQVPYSCAIVYDSLSDSEEQQFFLDRYNALYKTDRDLSWLHRYIDKPDFKRILVVASAGLACELLMWREGNTGIISFVQTSRRWRRKGIASYTVALACRLFEEAGADFVETTLHARNPHILKLFTKAGFHQSDLLMRYPGFDVNPE